MSYLCYAAALPLTFACLCGASRAFGQEYEERGVPTVMAQSPASSYTFDFTIDRRPQAGGASVLLESPSLTGGGDLQVRAAAGYGTLLIDDALPRGDRKGAVGVGLMAVGVAAGFHGVPGNVVIPAARLDGIFADIHSDELTSRKRAAGARAALAIEVPLTFLRDDIEDDDDDSASLVLQYARVFGLPKADKVAGGPDVLNGALASFGLRFYL